MKYAVGILALVLTCSALAQEQSTVDFFIQGHEFKPSKTSGLVMETAGSTAEQAGYNLKQQPPQTAVPVTSKENSESLRKTLESFQKAISGLCISHLELNLAFNVTAKAWIVAAAGVEANVKVILKNPDQKCPKS